MTSTPFNIGLSDNTRSSSRVLRPPGGGHTDIFGGEPEPTRGRRQGPPQPASQIGQGDHPLAAPTNGSAPPPAQNGNHAPPDTSHEPPQPKADSPREKIESPREVNDNKVTESKPEPAKPEAPKRVRVPPGGFSSGLCEFVSMEGGGRSRLSRLLNKLRGEPHHKDSLDKGISYTSAAMSENTGCDSASFGEYTNPENPESSEMPTSPSVIDDDQFAANIDLRYGGQYLTPEQLPEFCDQLQHLVEVIRNIQSYARVTGEYPTELEKRLEREAREVSALAAEARHARDVIARVKLQRHALKDHANQLREHLTHLNNTEIRELENAVRLSDRKLFKSWESLRETTDAASFDQLLDEITNKQAALECLLRLIEMKRSTLLKPLAPRPLPPPAPATRDNNEEGVAGGAGVRRRGARRGRRRRSPRSVPLSSEPSAHAHLPQVTLYIQGSESAGRRSVPLTPLELTSGGSVRDILFFTTNTP